MKINKTYILYICVFTLILFENCAKRGHPAGGPKDIEPPKVVKSTPENYTTNFNKQEFRVEFDEYIQLDKIMKELIVSPPMKKQPVVKLRGKLIEVEYEDTLRENTTYTFNFGNAIVDNNEGNPLKNYEFVFSTGDYLDSLSVRGMLVNSFDLKPYKEPLYVMLYDNLTDSAPLLEIPYYINRTNEEGYFSINNVKNDTFEIFALKDANNNMIFDMPNEIIAFVDSVLMLKGELYHEWISMRDTVAGDTIIDSLIVIQDTIIEMEDTTIVDSIPPEKHKNYAFHVDLFAFEQEQIIQYLTDNSRPQSKKLKLTFNMPLHEPAKVKLLNDTTLENWYIVEDEYAIDTLIYWITDTSVSNLEEIKMEVVYHKFDSIGDLVPFHDTLNFKYVKPRAKKHKKDQETEEVQAEKVRLNLSIKNNSTLELNHDIKITSSYPIDSVNKNNIQLFLLKDTIFVPQEYTFQQDTLLPLRRYILQNNWVENTTYKLVILPDAFKDVYDLGHDTVQIRFLARPSDYYGAILLNLSEVSSPLLVQLMLDNENIIEERQVDVSGQIKFDFLQPKEYRLKFVEDRNSNGKWDTGHYLKKRQPEKVKYYPEKINVRSNWDVEIDWKATFE